MITEAQLSDRLFQFFDALYGPTKTQFGFNADSNLAFVEDRQNNAIRSSEQTILFYRIDINEKVGNPISSDSQVYDRDTSEERIVTTRELTVVMSILSKQKGFAKDAINAFLAYLQSTRRETACYALPFPLVMINSEPMVNLSALEEGAWVERMEKNLTFRYNDTVVIGEAQFTQLPDVLEETKDIVQYELTLKK